MHLPRKPGFKNDSAVTTGTLIYYLTVLSQYSDYRFCTLVDVCELL